MSKSGTLRHPELQRREQALRQEALQQREMGTLLLVYLAGLLPPSAMLLLMLKQSFFILLSILGSLLVAGLGLCHMLAGRRARQLLEHSESSR